MDLHEKLIEAVVDNEKESLVVLREIKTLIATLVEKETQEHERINTNIRYHVSALVAIIILLILGVFALVNIKLQNPSIPLP